MIVTMAKQKPEGRDLFPGALEMMILQTLSRKPMHGYALAQHIKGASYGFASARTRLIPANMVLKLDISSSRRFRPTFVTLKTRTGRLLAEKPASDTSHPAFNMRCKAG